MKIIDKSTHAEFMHIHSGELAQFANKYIQQGFAEHGIVIPPGLREQYAGKNTVYLEDPEFEKAFRKLYYAFEMDHDIYQLIEDR